MTCLNLDVQYRTARSGVPAVRSIRRWVELALGDMTKPIELSVRIVDEKEGAALNQHWRQRDYATNVLSFQAELPECVSPRLLGDIVLCAPVIIKEARLQGKPARAHWAHLLVHGVLHLLGYDHQLQKDAEIMEERERLLLQRLGFANPYVAT